jgi:hypothetical protein
LFTASTGILRRPPQTTGSTGVTFEQAGTVFRESLALTTGYRDVPARKYAEDVADATDE